MTSSGAKPSANLPSSQLPPGWDVERLERVLFAAGSGLVRAGWVVLPDDFQDLVQSFLARFWEKMLPKFDSKRASFATYVHSHFVWFAKSWIIKERRLRQKQVDLDQVRDVYRISLVDAAEHAELSKNIHTAVNQLPQPTRDILLAYLSSDAPSQRELASKWKTTRHDIRTHLISGLGNLLVQFSKPSDVTSRDWKVFVCIYRDELTVAETARLLGLPGQEIRKICNSLLLRLAGTTSRQFKL
jgi:RNA polymerase sigma factor (sigma-70 family)